MGGQGVKNRNLNHSDDWRTPPYFYYLLDSAYNFDFDPCPYQHDISKWDGLQIDWGLRNFVNPGYSQKVKEAFVEKAVVEKEKGKLVVLLIPVSMSTKLYHDVIVPNSEVIQPIRGRIPFIGINSKGEYVNWHLSETQAPEGVKHVKNQGQHDSMIVVMDGIGTYDFSIKHLVT